MALAIDERRHLGGLSNSSNNASSSAPMELGNVSK